MITTVIFDLDGLLADTESLHIESYRRVFASHGRVLDELEYADHWIRNGRGIADYITLKKLTWDIDTIRRETTACYHHLVKTTVRPMPGAPALLDRLDGRKKLAVTSSSYRRDVHCVLDALKLTERFEVIAAKEDAARLKPAPDVFLFVAERLGVKPAECLVLEDAEKGVRAARAAGMACIAVPDRFTRDNDFSLATGVVSSLDDITPELLESL
jgi:HAD superfamily hydrolase (TIGR01509 family)